MKPIYYFIYFVGLLIAPSVFGQQMILKTDQLSYAYGDTIEIHVTIKNNTDSTLIISSGCTGGTSVTFNDYSFPNEDHAEDLEREYLSGQKRTFIYPIIPEVLGLPDRDGNQMVYGNFHGRISREQRTSSRSLSLKDSLAIEAQKYHGGRIWVRFQSETEESERQAIRDSLGVVDIIEQWDGHQLWQVVGHSIDSIAVAYEDDPRFDYLEPYRMFSSGDITKIISTTTQQTEDIPKEIVLGQNYPNPFNPVTVIPYELQQSAEVKLEVLDLLGRRVEILVYRIHQAGRHEVNWDASNVSSGIYLYRLSVDDAVLTRQMMLIR